MNFICGTCVKETKKTIISTRTKHCKCENCGKENWCYEI